MRGRTASLTACLLTVLAALSVPLASGAMSPGQLRTRAETLRQENAALASRSRSTALDLYAVEQRISEVGARLEALRARGRDLAARSAATRRQLTIARRSLRAAEQGLATRLRALYEQGDVDPVAVMLGARSLSDAIGTLDALGRSADADRDVIAQTRTAKRRLEALAARLAAQRKAVDRAASEAARTVERLADVRAARTAMLRRLARGRNLRASEIAALERSATAAAAKAAALNADRASPGAGSTGAPARGRTIVVLATGYSLGGRTSTGVPAGWGVAAVDPATIPLGTHLTVPGYGEAVAADTGSAVRGASIDLWFPTDAAARAWGRRMVSVTLH